MKLKKALSLCLNLLLGLALTVNPLLASTALAEEITDAASLESAEFELESTPTETPAPQPEPETSGEVIMETGDAQSEATSETEINQSTTCLEGQISTAGNPCAPPLVETPETEETCLPDQVNDALLDFEASASANTGANQIQTPASAIMDTGDATASATAQNAVNNNLVEFITPDLEASPSATSEAVPVFSQTIDNQVDAQGEVTAQATTGANQILESRGLTHLSTGDATAWANILNLLNTNFVCSDFQFFVLDLFGKQEIEVDLNAVYDELLDLEGEGLLTNDSQSIINQVFLDYSNGANLQNEVALLASTGQNQTASTSGQLDLETGDAQATANVLNFINLNFFGSEFLFGVINIFGDFVGNLILPRPEQFLGSSSPASSPGNSAVLNTQNSALVGNDVSTQSNTGANLLETTGASSLETGNAQSTSHVFNFLNTDLIGNDFFYLLINNLGTWTGSIFGWNSPGSQQAGLAGSQLLDLSPASTQAGSNQSLAPVLTAQNEVHLENNVSVAADTGANQVSAHLGEAQMRTGNASAIANVFNLANLNVVGSRWFMGVVNILGSFSGDIIFAYPDIALGLAGPVEVDLGQEFAYDLSYQNQGHAAAEALVLEVELPPEVDYLGNSAGLTPDIRGNSLSWHLGQLPVGQNGQFSLFVRAARLPAPRPISWFSKLIPSAHAAANQAEFGVSAQISNSLPESDAGNNHASYQTLVNFEVQSSSSDGSSSPDNALLPLPQLEIKTWNNVVDGIYPGDTVTLEITVLNNGPTVAYDVILEGWLVNSLPFDLGETYWELGDLYPGQKVTVSFGLSLVDDLYEGDYAFVSQAFGTTADNQECQTETARSPFLVLLQKIHTALLEPAQAAGQDEQILGICDQDCPDSENILPYLLSFFVSALWLINKLQDYEKNHQK